MITISPTRISIYDFLYHDTQPMVSLLADAAQLSLPQARLAITSGLQAIISALLAYQLQYKAQAVSKKLFASSAVKEMRQYNAMNFATVTASLYSRNDITHAIFSDISSVMTISDIIANQIDATTIQVKTLVTSLCVIVLRELAILADYSQLDDSEIGKWFALQPQFLSSARFIDMASVTKTIADTNSSEITPPPFDYCWFEISNFELKDDSISQDMQQATSNYLKAIGRSSDNIQSGRHNDLLVFAPMASIYLPHQRWLLQLAKISDIYLSRDRLRINSEPKGPPAPPLTSLDLKGDNSNNESAIAADKLVNFNKPVPLWKNPIIFIIIFVIGGLGGLAVLKFQAQKSNGVLAAKEAVYEHDHAEEIQEQKDREKGEK